MVKSIIIFSRLGGRKLIQPQKVKPKAQAKAGYALKPYTSELPLPL